MYKKAIIDECNTVVQWIDEIDEQKISEILDEFPEYRVSCVKID